MDLQVNDKTALVTGSTRSTLAYCRRLQWSVLQ